MSSRLTSLHSPKYLKERKRKRSILLFLSVLAVLSVLAAGILLLRLPSFQIGKVEVEGSTFASKEEIARAALNSLTGSYLGIVPRSNIFFFPKSKITEAVRGAFPEVQDFSIHRTGWGEITISLAERVPVAIVCAGFREDGEHANCFWSDKRAYLFSSTASSSIVWNDGAYDRFYVPGQGENIGLGKTFIDEGRFSDLVNFMEGALKGGLLPLGVLIGENGEYEMYVKNKGGDTEATIYFDDRSPFEATLSNLITFWNDNGKTGKATTTQAYNYINLRFGNAVYYSSQ